MLATAAPWALVALIGAVFGATELIARYKDQPFATLKSRAALTYVGLNAGAALLALLLLDTFDVTFGAQEQAQINAYRVMVAGLGAMAFFRAGLFNVRVGSSDISVGPNLILETFLQALDRRYDRERAAPRALDVSRLMKGVVFERAKEALPLLCFNLMQNVSDAEKAEIGDEVRQLGEAPGMSDEAKCNVLGLILLNVVGKSVLETAISSLGATITGLPPLDLELLSSVARADDALIVASLPEACWRLAGPGLTELADVAELQDLALPAQAKAILIVRRLVRDYGEGIVGPALAAIGQAGSTEVQATAADAERPDAAQTEALG
ncbi:hypothetical protein [Ancylobacter amanitiformis]|uniref:DUF2336 domain-containing protein n=1 Tax=Ancylobacter amanitiformis TaxID=217069 RepID=A0ABU0LV41_9HYPH|nr:hypothetical protein [Ancylobacter amanitiformis]MDQ0512571.1 hypothetical protein [Ancylobacter amanitiformis]